MLTAVNLALCLGVGGVVAVALEHDLSALALWGALGAILIAGGLS
jgi:hypothetical protein